MWRLLGCLSLLAVLGALPAAAAGVGPVKIVMLDGCAHSDVQREIARLRTAVPTELDSSAMDLGTCQLDPAQATATITSLAQRLEAERKAAQRRRAPLPVTIVYTGAFLEGPGAASFWKLAVQRLSRIALIVSPGGNDPDLDAAQVWPSFQLAFKAGRAVDGASVGSLGAAIGVYVDYGPPIEVVLGNVHFQAAGSSTAAMVTASHLANVLATGTGQKLSPVQLLKRLKSAFRQRVLTEDELEASFAAALR